MMKYFEKTSADLLKIVAGGAGMSCLPFSEDPRLKLAAIEMRHQINGPLSFAIEQPLQIVSSWNEPAYGDFIEASDTWFVSDRLRALVEETGEADVEFFPAFIENYDRKRSKLRPKVSTNDMTPGHAGGGSRVEGYWWMNLWAQENLLDRKTSVGLWHDGGRLIVRNNLDGKAGTDSLGRDPQLGRAIVLKAPPSKPIFQLRGLQRFLFVSKAFAATLESHDVNVRVTGFRPSD